MMRSIRFSELALDHTLEIYENLEGFKPGLGDRFYERLRVVYDQIKNNAASFQALDDNGSKRRAFLKLTSRLHYRVIYEIMPDYVEIQAIRSTWQR